MINLIKELGDASKRTILGQLKNGPKSVNDIAHASGMKQPNVSNHLARMKSKGIVRSTKVGRQVFYSLASVEISEALNGLLVSEGEESGTELILNEELTKQFCRSAVAGDEQECTAIVDRLLSQKIEVIDIYEQLFGSSLQMIGTWWQVGAIDVGQEHLASAVVERLMARAIHHAVPPQPGAQRAILGCPPGNWHTLGLRMVSDLLRLSGWKTYFLGANVPIDSFISAVKEHQPHAVLFSCPIEDILPEVDTLIDSLNKLKKDGLHFTIVGGGAAVIVNEEKYRSQGVDFIGHNLKHFRDGFIRKASSETKPNSNGNSSIES